MSIQSEAAIRFQNQTIRSSNALTLHALRLWNSVSVADLDTGWDRIEPELLSAVNRATVGNAAASGGMVSRVARADRAGSGDVIRPNAFAGIDGSGRSATGLLHGAVTTTKERIGTGVSPHTAFTAGAAYLAAMTRTLVADLARSSAAVASVGRSYTRYVRVVNPGACDRCAVLAGSDRFTRHFERHPSCRCTSVPVREGESVPDGLFDSPEEHFWSLSEAEQDRIYTKAGAEAIRMGANPIQVVNARRGASGMAYSRSNPGLPGKINRMQRVQIGTAPNGSPIMGYTTLEGTSRHGVYGRMQRDFGTAGRSRLMPETILELTEDTDLRRVLLRDAGYLETPIRDRSGNDWLLERLQQQQDDRVAADEFYRSLGIQLY